tara:strand:+ start:6923 stop:8032 length:1110 start_codon:yes stop_codon:yes gene_type:complete
MINKKLILFMPFMGGGGVEKNLLIISEFLSKKYNNLYVCTCSKKFRRKFNKNIKFISTNSDLNNKVSLRLQYFISLYLLFKFIIKNKDSVVFAFQANIYCIILCKLLGIKIIVRSNSSPSGWYHNIFKKIIYKKIISIADAVVVNSKDFKKEMDINFKIKTHCIYNPLNFNQIVKLSKKNLKNNFFKDKKSIKLINIGRFTKQKDQITILKAAKLLKNKINFKLLIMGRGIEKKNLMAYILKYKLNKEVKIIKFQNNPYNFLKKADILILSSKYEGLPNVLLEAAVLKKFIISTKCPTGPKEILQNGKGGIFFKVGDYVDLTNKIKFYLNNKRKLNKKILYSYNKLNRFDYTNNLNKYFYLINKFMTKN